MKELTIILTVLFYSRDPIDLVDCFQRHSTLYFTGTPGKFLIDERNQGKDHYFIRRYQVFTFFQRTFCVTMI